ncbi:MAG: endopeptidase [Solirubrobacterales bacterium]|jgi:STE24 endopeptidase|nr:endopeptidase [Solirubrobacterales bacterium]
MSLPRSTVARVGGAAVAMILVAEAAVWLLSPRDRPPDPVPVAESDYFSPAELERAHDYRDPQRPLLFAGLAVEVAILTVVALGRPAALRRALERLAARPLPGAAVAGAGFAILTTAASLPLSLVSHERAVDAGLSTQSLGSWLWDLARSAGITALLTAGGAALLLALVRRFPRRWWIPGAALTTGLAVVFVWIAPVVLAPIYNKFEPLPESSRARADVLALGREAGVDIGQVYRVDASRRVTSLNAFVDGIGSTKRVVLYDNLLEQAERPILRSVVAHELGHVAHDDIRRGLIFVAIVAPFGLLFVRELSLAIARRRGVDPASPSAVPIYLVALTVAAFALNIPGNQLSRRIEASADQFALQLTHDPGALVDLQVQLAKTNLSDPDPPGWLSAVFGTHPTTVQRIGAALSARGE